MPTFDDSIRIFDARNAESLASDLFRESVPTEHKYLIVKWFAGLPEAEGKALIDSIAAIGPF